MIYCTLQLGKHLVQYYKIVLYTVCFFSLSHGSTGWWDIVLVACFFSWMSISFLFAEQVVVLVCGIRDDLFSSFPGLGLL